MQTSEHPKHPVSIIFQIAYPFSIMRTFHLIIFKTSGYDVNFLTLYSEFYFQGIHYFTFHYLINFII